MLLDVAGQGLSGGLPFRVGGLRFRLTFGVDGFFDRFFQLIKQALALCAVGACGFIHSVVGNLGWIQHQDCGITRSAEPSA